MNNQQKHSVEIIRYEIPQDLFKGFEAAYSEAGVLLKKSPYCLGFHLPHGDDEPTHYLLTIYWTSKEDHMTRFRRSQEFSGFFNLVKPYYNYIKEMKHYKETSLSWRNASMDSWRL